MKNALKFTSNNQRLLTGLEWAREQAMAYVRDHAPVGPCYESALPGRDAFCMRDVSHQAGGAHVLGLEAHNRNMMEAFARSADEAKDWCGWWEITTEGLPAPVDYTDDGDFWYNLPANFDVMDACSRLYDLTGDAGYLTAPVFERFFRISTGAYVRRWDRDGDGIVDRVDADGRRGIASYDESEIDGYRCAADALCLEYAGYLAAARMCVMKGEDAQAERFRESAEVLREIFCRDWWNGGNNCFYTYQSNDGAYRLNRSFDNAVVPLRCGIVRDRWQIEGQLDYLVALEPEMNVEIRSYLPAVLWRYGRDEQAMAVWLKMTAEDYPRREYPEVAYAAVESLFCGYMGISADADLFLVRTRSALLPDEWAEAEDFPLWNGSIILRHEGRSAGALTNRTGRTLIWEAVLDGEVRKTTVPPGASVRVTRDGAKIL